MKLRRTKKLVLPTAKKYTVNLLDDDNLSPCAGFVRRDEKLFCGMGASVKNTKLKTPANVTCVFYSQGNGALYAVADGQIYVKYKKSTNFYSIYTLADSKLFFVDVRMNGEESTVIFCGNDRILSNGNGESTQTDSRLFYTGAMHCGRFFARDLDEGLKIYWSSGTPFEWADGIRGCGYAYLTSDGGSVLKLINYDEKLIAVRERGLTVMRAYGEPQNYKLDESANYYTADGVIENTVATCFNKLFFCTASGIFAFDGNDVERQEYDDSGDIYGYVSAVGYGDRYYVLCSSKRLGKQLVYVYEPINKCGYFMNFSPECLVVCDGLYAFSDGRLYLLEEGTGDGQWKRCGVDFGLASKKVLASIDMQSYGDVKVTVSGGGISKTFSGSGAKQVRLSGNSFDFEVSGCGDVYALTATAEAINEV